MPLPLSVSVDTGVDGHDLSDISGFVDVFIGLCYGVMVYGADLLGLFLCINVLIE